jgi:DNA repair exonuclease SbcCD ATPase subunit
VKANEYVDRLRKRIKDLEQKVDQLSGDYERWSENEIARLRAEVEELKESERGLKSMNDGLADWNLELRKQVEILKRPCSCLTHFMMNRKLEEKNRELRHEVEELKRNQLKPRGGEGMSDDNIIRLNTTFDLSPLYEANENAIKSKLRELGWVNLDPGERVCSREFRIYGNYQQEQRFKVSQLISKILGPYGSPLSPTTETGDTPLEISRRDDG